MKRQVKENHNEEIIKEFIKEFCNDHNGYVRFLRGVFYDERDGAESIISFISQALSQKDTQWREKIKKAVEDFYTINPKYRTKEKLLQALTQELLK